jgi:signal transduction histidine kinase
MPSSIWKKHPFPLLFYLEWILLGIALLAVFSTFRIHPHPPHTRSSLEFSLVIFKLGALLATVTLGAIGLRLPFGSSFLQTIYISVGFALSWLVVLLAGKAERVFPALLLIVVIRACVLFPWSGRLIVAIFAYTSFISVLVMSLFRVRPLGVPLGRPIPLILRRLPSDDLQGILFHLTFSSVLLFGLVLAFVLLLVGAVLAENQSPEGKVRQNWTTFSSPGFGIANFSFLAGKTSYLLITKLGLLTIKMLVLPRLSNFVQFHWTREKLATANYRLRQYALTIESQAALQERNRIAREIHDSVGHCLTAQSIQLENVAVFLSQDTEKAKHYLEKARQLGKEALQNVRSSVAALRNDSWQGRSLDSAVKEMSQKFVQTTDISLQSQISLSTSVPLEMATALYRTIQEALTNIAKHSQATQVLLKLSQKGGKIYLQL